MSIRQACKLFKLSTASYYYKPKQNADNERVAESLRSLAIENSNWGFWMMFHYLRNNNHSWNHKRVYRVYTDLKLNKRRKFKRRIPSREPKPLVQPIHPNINWSMDFMHDSLQSGKTFRTFNVVDDFNREALTIAADTSLPSQRVIRELEQLIQWRGCPERIRVDNGPEFIAQKLSAWCADHDITLDFIQKGKPTQNAFIERFNRSYRTEILDAYSFENLIQVRQVSNAWIWKYNNERPHKSLGYLTPRAFLLKYGKLPTGQPAKSNFPTFQQDDDNGNYFFKSIFLNVAE